MLFSQSIIIPQNPKEYRQWLSTFEKINKHVYLKFITKGSGSLPRSGDYLLVHYTGYLQNNYLFDSSIQNGEPLGFNLGVGQVIKGWDEALRRSPEGSKIQVVVYPEAGYGNQSVGKIPANSTLFFEIELIKVIAQTPIEPYNIKNQKIKKLSNGIRYAFVNQVDGIKPDTNYIVTIHFTGYLPDGTIFDTSILNGEPEKFVVGSPEIIAGINLAVQNMSKGSKARFFIPYKLAFGKDGYSTLIPPKTDVIFDIEMLDIKEPQVIAPYQPHCDSIALDSGVYYFPIEATEGMKPKQGEIVSIHYSGYYEDGTLFDSSIKRDQPVMFMIGENHIIPGLEKAILHMSPGDKIRVFIPWQQAYGEEGNPPIIPPKTNLIFDIHLLDFIQR